MERFYRICFIFLLCIVSFAGGFFTKNIYLYHVAKNLSEITGELPRERASEASLEPSEPDAVKSVQAMNLKAEPEMNGNTEYYIYEYNSKTEEGSMVRSELPASLDGATREGLESYLAAYLLSPSLSDREKGLVSASVFEFSPEKVVVEKVFEQAEAEEECFYLKSEENYVVVYCADLRTVYQYTDIRYDSLPEGTRDKIDKIMKVDSLEELYSFLESYTS